MDDSDDYEVVSPSDKPGQSLAEVMTKAEIDMQISTAKAYPRSIKQFVNDATQMVSLNEQIAESCNYSLPRGNKFIMGPSVRFAEIVLSAWGNTRAGARVVHEDGRFITAQGVCHDLQRNTMVTMEVKRRITDKKGKTLNDDMIGVTGNASASIALRNAILRSIPKAFWEPIYEKSRSVALGESKPMANRRADALGIMMKFGVTPEMIFAKFEIKGIEDLTIEHLEMLNGAKTSIKEGISTAEELFALPKAPDEGKGNDAVKSKLKKNTGTPHDSITGEVKDDKKPETKQPEPNPDKGKDEKKVIPDPEQRETESVKIDRPLPPVFNTGAIPAKGRPDDNTQPDFEGWKLEFMKRCNTCPSLPEIATFFKHNVTVLNQIKSRMPEIYEECDRCYNDAVERLKAEAEQRG